MGRTKAEAAAERVYRAALLTAMTSAERCCITCKPERQQNLTIVRTANLTSTQYVFAGVSTI